MVLVTSSVGCISEDTLIVVLLVVLCSKVESVTVATSIATVELSGEVCEPSMVDFSVSTDTYIGVVTLFFVSVSSSTVVLSRDVFDSMVVELFHSTETFIGLVFLSSGSVSTVELSRDVCVSSVVESSNSTETFVGVVTSLSVPCVS